MYIHIWLTMCILIYDSRKIRLSQDLPERNYCIFEGCLYWLVSVNNSKDILRVVRLKAIMILWVGRVAHREDTKKKHNLFWGRKTKWDGSESVHSEGFSDKNVYF